MNNRVVMVLSNAFISDPRVYKECKFLIDNGYKVTILAWDRELEGKSLEYKDGIEVKRFKYKSIYGQGFFKQSKAYLEFLLKCRKEIQYLNPDFLHFHDLDTGLLNLLLFGKKKYKRILDLHEQYDMLYSGLKRKIVRFLVKKVSKKIDHFILVNNFQYEDYKGFLLNKKVTILSNFPEKRVFKDLEKKKSDKINISFIGAVRDYPALELLIKAFANNEKYQLNIIGKGVAQKRIKEEFGSLSNIKLVDFFEYKDILDYYNETDLTYAVYDTANGNSNIAIPVKVYESIICNIPVIVSEGTEVAKFVKDLNVGITINFGDIESLKSEIDNLFIEDCKRYNRLLKDINKCNFKFTWEEEVQKLNDIYKEVGGK